MKYFKGLALALLLFNGVACAQTPAQQVAPCVTNPPTTNNPMGGCTPVTTLAPFPITGSFSVGSFVPGATGTPISVTTGGVSGTLPAGTTVVATNVGATNGAYCALGASATTSSQYIAPNGGWFAFGVGAGGLVNRVCLGWQ